MEKRIVDSTLISNASTSGNFSLTEADEYPDPASYNLSDRHDQQLFMQKYQAAQQHDPQMKIAILVFYLIIVSLAPYLAFFCIRFHTCNFCYYEYFDFATDRFCVAHS